jgi:RNA methyltransferase, TrmH family
MESITSLQNPMIKKYLRLSKSRRFRQRTNCMAIEGPNLIREALQRGVIPEAVITTMEYSSGQNGKWFALIPNSTKRIIISDNLFGEITGTETPQAVAAIVPYSFGVSIDNLNSDLDLVLILDQLQDPGNLGTLIRTAAASGVQLICCTKGCVDPYSPKVLRSTAGSIFQVKMLQDVDGHLLISNLKQKGFQLLAAATTGDFPYWTVDLSPKNALIVGSEARGISAYLMEQADLSVTIPTAAAIDSLNAAVAAGIILFDINRRRALQ